MKTLFSKCPFKNQNNEVGRKSIIPCLLQRFWLLR